MQMQHHLSATLLLKKDSQLEDFSQQMLTNIQYTDTVYLLQLKFDIYAFIKLLHIDGFANKCEILTKWAVDLLHA